jgi:hypothetical protein
MSTLKLGFAKKSINPPVGVGLAGYCLKPDRTVQSILDEMFARAVVFDDGEHKAALVSADTIFFGNANAAMIRARIQSETGIPSESIMLTATHSHSAPTTAFLRHWGETNPAYVDLVHNQTVQAVVEAAKATVPVVLGSGQTQLPGLAFNRVRKDGPVDHTLRVLAARDPQSKKLAFVLSHFGLHPVHMPTNSRYASADFPGRATRDLERFFSGANAAFIQGTCGDIDPIRHFEGVDAVQDTGRAVADSTRQVIEGLQFDGKPTLSNAQVDCDLPLDWDDARREATEYLFHGKVRSRHEGLARSTFVREWANEILGLSASNPPPYLRSPIQALRIGNVALVALPGEIYTLIGEAIRSRSPFKDTWVVSYANGAVGYLCDPRDYPEETYGAVMTPKILGYPPFKPNAWEVVVESSLRALKQLS